jgi:hypothetical protein
VDRETYVFHPRINHFKRCLLARVVDRVFVTERHLVHRVVDQLGVDEQRVGVASFGPIDAKADSELERHYYYGERSRREEELIPEGEGILFVCVGNYYPKILSGIRLCLALAARADQVGLDCPVLVAGPQIQGLARHHPETYRALTAQEGVVLCAEPLSLFRINAAARAAGRALVAVKDYDDLSMPLAVYSMAAQRIPFVAGAGSFLAEIASAYGSGLVVDPESPDLEEIVEFVHSERAVFAGFLAQNSWDLGSQELARLVRG